MNHKILLVNYMRQRKIFEGGLKQQKSFLAVFGLNFSRKSVHIIQIKGLMVASVKIEAFWTNNLKSIEGDNHLDRKGTSINKIPIEQIWSLFSWVPVKREDIQQIVKLPVNIPANNNALIFSGLYILDIAFFVHDILCSSNQNPKVFFIEFFAVFEIIQKSLYPLQIDWLIDLQSWSFVVFVSSQLFGPKLINLVLLLNAFIKRLLPNISS